MNVAIIGAGYAGLSAAYTLMKRGHSVTIFEKDSKPGGLALGFKKEGWKWSLENHYHHLFSNNKGMLDLAKELKWEMLKRKPKTSVYYGNKMYRMDSPLSVLQFPVLSLFERLRMGIVIGMLRFNPFWKALENFSVANVLPPMMGKKPYKVLWEPLLKAKFGKYSKDISLAWFWGRVSERTFDLAYPKEGFMEFTNFFARKIQKQGGKIIYHQEVKLIESNGKKVKLTTTNKVYNNVFDKVIVTLPSSLLISMVPALPPEYKAMLKKLQGIGAVNMVLRLKKPFLKDGTYWLNVCQKSPFLAVVEHTNLIDKKYYNNEHLVYIGNYLPSSHPFFKMSSSKLLKTYEPFLKKINPEYKKTVIDVHIFKAEFAQPIIPLNYSKIIPQFETPLKNVYLANLQQVYPWDRGISHAVDLGKKVADLI